MLMDPDLRDLVSPAEHNTFDWNHCVLQGLWQTTVYESMAAIKPYGFSIKHLYGFLQTFSWPRRIASKGATGIDMFDAKRGKKSWDKSYFSCTASEAMSVHVAVAHSLRRDRALPSSCISSSCGYAH